MKFNNEGITPTHVIILQYKIKIISTQTHRHGESLSRCMNNTQAHSKQIIKNKGQIRKDPRDIINQSPSSLLQIEKQQIS